MEAWLLILRERNPGTTWIAVEETTGTRASSFEENDALAAPDHEAGEHHLDRVE
jgi:hypothetical protein